MARITNALLTNVLWVAQTGEWGSENIALLDISSLTETQFRSFIEATGEDKYRLALELIAGNNNG